jgi:DNA-binding transcriptional ArsR family regulator/predicted RNA-binding Zn-ribbon protein involved in translation (DUF1610 family)
VESEEVAETLNALGNENRIDIIRTLGRFSRPRLVEEPGILGHPNYPASFSQLYNETDVTYRSQFSYHLEELEGKYITEFEDGYGLTWTGQKVVSALASREYSTADGETVERLVSETRCGKCGEHGSVVATYDGSQLDVRCLSCSSTLTTRMVPPALLNGRTDEEVLAAFDSWQQRVVSLFVDGVCHECSGQMSLIAIDGHCESCQKEVSERETLAQFTCQNCSLGHFIRIGEVLRLDHRVVAFHEEMGEPLDDLCYWELPYCISDDPVTVEQRDPFRADVRVTLSGETLAVTLDDELNVAAVSRE